LAGSPRCEHLILMKRSKLLTTEYLHGWPGLSRQAQRALVDRQPSTVLEALRIRGVGRKTTKRLLAVGLVTDPDGAQHRLLQSEVEALEER